MIDILYSFQLELIKPMWLVLLHEYCQHMMTFSIVILNVLDIPSE